VVLNADSELSYSQKEWEQDRRLTLDGEAYFKVAKGAKFTVETEQGEIAVLGTEFNVRQRNGMLEVSCFEGKVQVKQGAQTLVLIPGQAVQILHGNWQEQEVVAGAQPSWMTNESRFKSVPLKIVFNELQRQFEVDVDSDGVDLNTLFSGSFSNTDLNLALESISIPTQMRYTRDGKKVLFYAKNTP
jgi:ferric-dicitrate binding protein FerR (iron transport regulator)